MNKVNRFIFTTLVMFLFWLAYTSTFQIEEVLTGLFASIVISFFTYDIFTTKGFSKNTLSSIFNFLYYIPVFIIEMVKANIDVAKRVINPSLPINPGIVAIKTDLQTDTGKLFLANSITLTPGTLTIDVIDDILYIHWIDVKSDNTEEQQKLIAGKFEKLLRRIF